MQQVHVAVAVIINPQRQVLVSLRPAHVHQGDLWEFPGGKVEESESVEAALRRELEEELGIQVIPTEPFKTIVHRYSDKQVLLDIFKVYEYRGEPHGREGQPVKWLGIDELDPDAFPAANKSIIRALQLPEVFMITGRFSDTGDFLERLEASLKKNIRLVQLRAKNTGLEELKALAAQAAGLCHQYGAKLLVNIDAAEFDMSLADGLHLTSQQLHSLKKRPFDNTRLLSASCHTLQDLAQAQKLNADMVLLSPVKETRSHPGVPGIGWKSFREMTEALDIPVYALGGMSEADLPQARQQGAQGVAAISSFWG